MSVITDHNDCHSAGYLLIMMSSSKENLMSSPLPLLMESSSSKVFLISLMARQLHRGNRQTQCYSGNHQQDQKSYRCSQCSSKICQDNQSKMKTKILKGMRIWDTEQIQLYGIAMRALAMPTILIRPISRNLAIDPAHFDLF